MGIIHCIHYFKKELKPFPKKENLHYKKRLTSIYNFCQIHWIVQQVDTKKLSLDCPICDEAEKEGQIQFVDWKNEIESDIESKSLSGFFRFTLPKQFVNVKDNRATL